MPQGKGTYGNQVGRPSKKETMASGDPEKKKSVKANMPSVDVKAKKLEHKKEKAPYSKTERKEHVPQTVRDKRPNYEAKMKPGTDRAPAPPNPDREGRIRRGPRSEGQRGKGTGWAN